MPINRIKGEDNMNKRKLTEGDASSTKSKSKKPNKNGAEIAAVKQSSEIFMLNLDCFEAIFNHLTRRDLISFGKMCKWFQHMAAHIFLRHYAAIDILYERGAARVLDKRGYFTFRLDFFAEFIHKIIIHRDSEFKDFLRNHSEFREVHELQLEQITIVPINMDAIEEFFSKLKVLRLKHCDVEGDFHEIVLNFCPNLKHLYIKDFTYGQEDDTTIGTGNAWLSRNYSKLESVEFDALHGDEVANFLQLNPNVRKLASVCENITKSKDAMLKADITLDDLAIYMGCDESDYDPMIKFLNELHERGFYNRLQMYMVHIFGQQTIDKLASLKALTKIEIFNLNKSFVIPVLNNIEELYFSRGFIPDDFEAEDKIVDSLDLGGKFPNLKRVHFMCTSCDRISALLQRAIRLNKIKVTNLGNGIHFKKYKKIIDLSALNKLREQLAGAHKVTIYVTDDIFWATKKAFKQTDFSLVQIKRIDSFEWNHDFKFRY